MNDFNSSISKQYKDHLYEEFGGRFEDIKAVVPGFRPDQEVRLGILLENISEAFDKRMSNSLNESSTQVSSVADGIKNQYLDIVTAVYPGLISEELFSIQPIKQKTAQIFYLKYVYGDDKGTVKKGSTIFGANEIAGYENSKYTSEEVEAESLFEASDVNTVKVFSGNLAYIPVRPGTVKITVDAATDISITDNGSGVLSGAGVTGSIDYVTGAYSLTFTTAPVSAAVDADYEFDLSYAPSTIPSIEIKVVDTTVTARPRKLKGTYSLDAGYDLQQSQGIDIKESLLEAAAMTLRNETDGDLILQAYQQAGSTITWVDTYNNQTMQLSRKDYYEDFIDCIVRGASIIRQKTKRVGGNWIVVGRRGGEILTFLGAPRFVTSGNTTAVGPYYAGTLDGTLKVYIDPFLGENDFLIGYKGNNLIDAGLIFAPYLLFFATETVMLEDFLGRRGFASTYGKKMVNANLYVRGTIVQNAGNTTTQG